MLAAYLDNTLEADAYPTALSAETSTPGNPVIPHPMSLPVQQQMAQGAGDLNAFTLISQQIALLSQQVSIFQQGSTSTIMTPAPIIQPSGHSSNQQNVRNDLTSEESVELKKPFGATARIEKKALGLTDMQHAYLNTFIAQYSLKPNRSKSYTQENRPHMADPRVVSGLE